MNAVHSTVGFWCQGWAQKIFRTFDTSFETFMMVKNDAIAIIFKSHEPFKRYLLGQFSQNGWLGLASQQVTLKGLVGFENNFDGTTFHHHHIANF